MRFRTLPVSTAATTARRTSVLRTVAMLVLLALGLSTGTQAQIQTQAEANIPWNGYTPLRITNNFESIVNNGGTFLVNGDDATRNVTLPFAFFFIDQGYSTISVSTNGWLSFNTTTAAPYTPQLNPGVTPNRSVYAFWTDWYPTGAGQGVYYRFDGVAPNRVAIIEWYGPNIAVTGTVGNAQVKLFENRVIEWHYGPSINSSNSSYYSPIGLKDVGQYQGDPTGSSDNQKYLLFNDPERRTTPVAYTRLRTGNGSFQPEWYSNMYSPFETYFHTRFPTLGGQQVGFRVVRTLDDVTADSVWFTPTRVSSAYPSGASVTINARFRNVGVNTRTNLPVRADVYRNGVYLESRTSTVFTSGGGFGAIDFTSFAQITAPSTNFTGAYEVRVYPQLTGDEDATNDTVRGTFYISRSNDVTPYSIQQPSPNTPPLFQKYPVGIGVPIEIRYLNIGLLQQSNVKVGYYITDASGNVVMRDSTVLAGLWPSLTYRDHVYPAWTPTTPGSYFIRAITMMAGDEEILNDTFPKLPATGLPFEVRYEIEILALAPPLGTVSPFPTETGQTYAIGKPAKVSATFGNSGVSDATNVPVRVQIRNGSTVVYDRTATVLDITGGGGRTEQRFPDFYPTTAGTYCATAFSEYAQEPLRGNDTMTWCFTVKPALSGTIRIGFGERFASIQEARDSLFYYGVAGPVNFELTNDTYTITTTEIARPALDLRGRIVGVGANAPVTFRPALGKTMVTIALRSASGIGMWFGQLDTSNPSGYITFDGTTRKALTITYENTNTNTSQPAYQRSLPMFYGQGASNYAILNT
ncbi:MAG TPA: hypothetical protein VNA88_02005, partial [Candidatus Kapabacteria bacterium]|nr:hypothetical protein [Candidatus Kapabacteria bacterium]